MNKYAKPFLHYVILLFLGFALLGGLIITLQLIFIPSLRSPVFLPSPLVNYEAKNWPFSIGYPKTWNIHEFVGGDHNDHDVIAIINPPGKSQPRVEISSKEIHIEGKESVIQWGTERAKACNGFKAGSQREIRISAMDAIQFDYQCLWRQYFFSNTYITINCTDYFFINHTTAYDLSFCVPDKQKVMVLPIYEQMLQSFTLR